MMTVGGWSEHWPFALFVCSLLVTCMVDLLKVEFSAVED